MGPLGLLGMEVPEAYGGAEMDAISAAIAVEELGWGCGSTALAISAHNGLGLGPIVRFGSEAQKQQWLPKLAQGQGKLACLSLTEPGAGSDLQGGVRTAAVREGDSWIIDGSKMWMTNASISDVMVVLVRTDPAGGSRSLLRHMVPAKPVFRLAGTLDSWLHHSDRICRKAGRDAGRPCRGLICLPYGRFVSIIRDWVHAVRSG